MPLTLFILLIFKKNLSKVYDKELHKFNTR